MVMEVLLSAVIMLDDEPLSSSELLGSRSQDRNLPFPDVNVAIAKFLD
jgi:hypothetical protein